VTPDPPAHDDQEAEIAGRFRTGYRLIPAGTADEWGDPEAFHTGLVRAREQQRSAGDGGQLSSTQPGEAG